MDEKRLPICPTGVPSGSAYVQTPSSARTVAQIKQDYFDLAISLSLSTWSSLSTAVANGWGGPESTEKRDWFAGAISDLFLSQPDIDGDDLECVLLQVMEDEFQVRVEDETEIEVAARILRLRRDCERGDFAEVLRLHQNWTDAQTKRQSSLHVNVQDVNDEVDTDESVDGDDHDSDVEMVLLDNALEKGFALKPESEVDEEGFTLVKNRKA